ncbi:putative glycoside hydrolase family 16 protein [Botrytis fragariae]|uniref:Putative glycoside hydrolase family 16 protein n=1 Tax=Botrytis fragariae TaxID=1964551 RepID=A0A8H6EGD9_9HELO|nr:putative glycoside hydrolase family 16 protein [Botrytis fragariae]KAF5871188.1 putative glycoside hydrolase family 16 protein [Botrytis fragariae]
MMSSKSSLSLGVYFLSILSTINAQYSLAATYNAANFFSDFTFFTAADPTAGYVVYEPLAAAEEAGLVSTANNQVYLGVDHTTLNPSGGRESVRLTSNQAWGEADIEHMPGGVCGIWPAFWMFGPNWPNSGEIDIIEGVNLGTTNTITLHTAAGCTVSNANSQSGTTTITSNCNQDNAGTGCGVATSNTQNYGTGFNAIGGGVYAMQWASTGIYVWFWPRGSIPADITAKDIDNIVFDTTFCGTWAGSVWSSGSCASAASTCQAYVAQNPSAFTNAYWLINYVQVWQ